MSRGESKVDLLRLFLSLLLSPDPTRATPVIMAKHDRVGSGVKHLSRTDSRPVTWVIKIKHAGLGVLGQATSHKLDKQQGVGYYEIRKAGNMTDKKTISIAEAVERMITAVNIVTGDDGSRSQRAVVTFIELLKMSKEDYAKQQKFYG